MNTNDDIERLRKELEQSRRESARLQSENAKLKGMLEAFSVKPAAFFKNQPPQRHDESQPDQAVVIPATNTSKSIADERIRLFGPLFRGREDVYAVCLESKKGKSGFSPASAHD